MGTGEHFFVDLVVAFPFALLICGLCAYPVSWKAHGEWRRSVVGLGVTLAWLATLRYGAKLFWSSPIVPWALSAATMAIAYVRQAKLDAANETPQIVARSQSGKPACASIPRSPNPNGSRPRFREMQIAPPRLTYSDIR